MFTGMESSTPQQPETPRPSLPATPLEPRTTGVSDTGAQASVTSGTQGETTLREDARELAGEAKQLLDPKTAITHAALGAVGAHGVKDALAAAEATHDAHQSTTPNSTAGTAPARGSVPQRPVRRAGAHAVRRAGTTAASKALGAGDLLSASTSDGTASGDVKAAVKSAKDGAALGAKIAGPVGTAVGGAAGAALGAAKTRRGRWLLAAGLLAVPTTIVLVLTLFIVSFASMIGGFKVTDSQSAADAAVEDGLTYSQVDTFHEAAQPANVPWEVLAATARELNGTIPESVEMTRTQLRNAVADNTPIGPFKIRYSDAQHAGRELGITVPPPADLLDLEEASEFVSELLSEQLETADLTSTDLSAGVTLADGDDGHQIRRINTSDREDVEAAEEVRAAYVDALSALPLDGTEAKATAIFETALAWHLGNTTSCVPTAGTTTVNGEWANPAIGPFSNHHETSDYNDGGHVGIDIDTPNTSDEPVWAAGSGTVIWAQSLTTSYGNHVKIDHGGGLITLYAHLDSYTVKVGDTVVAGQQIGIEGTSGNSSGDHLHLELIENGVPIDPEAFFTARGITLGTGTGTGTAGLSDGTSTAGTGIPLPTTWIATPSAGTPVTLGAPELGYASQIAATATTEGISDDAIVIAFMTVLVESKFKMYASDKYPETEKLPHDAVGSDHDSVGLFQQRPQSGWGTPTLLMDVAYSAKAFWGGPTGPNAGNPPGLLDIKDWAVLPKGTAAQSVQRSAFPDEYAKWETAATDLLSVVKGVGATTTGCGAATTGGSSYVLATFNVLGHSHTKPGGNKDHLGFDQYDDRLDSAMGYLTDYNVSVVGLQEFEPIQSRYFTKKYSDTYDVWPKNTSMTDAVAWRTSDWTFVTGSTFTIPYFSGHKKLMPYVKLRNNESGTETWFVNVHNPADARGPAGQWRTQSLAIEKALVARLAAQGNDVFLVGDFNDDDEPHCTLTTTMTSAFGAGTTAPCKAPAAVHIDQIFGTGSSTLSGGTQHREANNRQTSDHPLVTATVASTTAATGSYDLGAVQPQAATVANTLGPMFAIQTIGGIGTRANPTCHTKGLGLDFMVPLTAQGKTQGQELADYAKANAASLQINAVIWYQRIWTAQRAGEGWRMLEDRGDATANHMDHVHLSIAPCLE